MSMEQYETALTEAEAALDAYTVGTCKEEVAGNEVVAAIFNACVEGMGMKDDTKVAACMSKSVPEEQRLDLRLDNRWGPEDGHPLPFVRRNPIIFALSPPVPPKEGSEEGDVASGVEGKAEGGDGGDGGGASGGETELNQWSLARADPDGFRGGMVSFFEARGPEHEEDADEKAVALARKRWTSLLLFDFMCSGALCAAPEAFDKLARCSHLIDPTTAAPLPLQHHFSNLMAPIRAMRGRQELDSTPIVMGCQEMPVDARGEAKLREVLPEGLAYYRPTERGKGETGASGGTDEGTGFIYSNFLAASMKDVTDDLAPDLTQFLADQGVKPVVAATTLRKMLIVTVDLFYTGAAQSSGGEETRVEGAVGATTPKLAVATLHCKCFYKQAAQQGAFVARLIEQASKLEGVVGTVVCGDMNLDSPWPDKTSAEVQQASVGAAEFGCFPTAEGEGVTPIVNTNVTDFSTTVTKSGLQMVTPPTNFTTLKMRTKFQAQAGKIGAVAMGHKDQVSEC
mmetsp:Transcript_22423/g.57603  ORF Transcript_22423/g.57603 Transcript_22423/m.57603 type:complete len:511 (-) Transcript_22423:691-2223(-)